MSLHLPNFVDCVFSYANTVKFSECNLWILLNVGGPGRHAGRAGVKNMIEHVHSTRARALNRLTCLSRECCDIIELNARPGLEPRPLVCNPLLTGGVSSTFLTAFAVTWSIQGVVLRVRCAERPSLELASLDSPSSLGTL